MNTRRIIFALSFVSMLFSCVAQSQTNQVNQQSLKKAFEHKFLIGVAMNANQITGLDSIGDNVIISDFSSIVAENCMKSGMIQPEEGKFDFSLSDRFVNFGEKHKLYITGHTLIWHSQTPKWFFTDNNGQPVTREVLIDRMHKHIATVVGRYKGRVKGWDVVNEAINDDGSYRESPFYKIIGKDFIKLAFQFAHEADPNAQLYYNDYNMAMAGKREGVVKMVGDLKRDGVKIDAIGMQSHLGLEFPTLDEFEKSILAYSSLGVKVMMTELDLSILPSPWTTTGANVSDKAAYQKKMNPYQKGVPTEKYAEWEKVYLDFFKLFIKHQDKISRVTLWGLTDGDSWKNDWPIRGRTDYPLLYDRNHQPKPIVSKIIEISQKK